MGDLIAVAEEFGHDGWRRFFDQVSQGRVSGTVQVNAEAAEALHDGLWVDVAASSTAGEQPWCFGGAAGGTQVGSAGQVFADQRGERLGHWRWFCPEADAQLVRGQHDRFHGERGDPRRELPVQKQQRPGDAVGKGLTLPGQQLLKPVQALFLGQR